MAARIADAHPNDAVGYVRVSTQEQVRGGVSLDAQEERLRAYAVASGLTLVQLIREEGVSGGKPLDERPGGHELLTLVGRREVRHVIALKLDRLFRDAANCLTQTRRWDRTGVALHLVDMGGTAINTASAMGRMFLTMSAGFAELEKNLISERTSSALQHMKAHGKAYSPTPFGFDRDGGTNNLIRNDDEQRVLLGIRALRAQGWSLGSIAEDLNRRGVPTKTKMRLGIPTAGKWYPASVRYMLRNDFESTSRCAVRDRLFLSSFVDGPAMLHSQFVANGNRHEEAANGREETTNRFGHEPTFRRGSIGGQR